MAVGHGQESKKPLGDVGSFIFVLVVGPLFIVMTLLAVSVWRSGRGNRKWAYLALLMWLFFLEGISDWLYVLFSVPFAWQIGINGVLLALTVATLALLYRHDPDPPDLEVP